MPKVLIIEDEPLVARMYEKALKFDGFETIVAVGGKEGLEKAKSEKPDFIMCDIMMPEPDGIEVLERIKNDPETSNIPMVMLTNLSGKHDAELAMSKGANDYWVKKDADLKQLGERIRAVLGAPADEKTS